MADKTSRRGFLKFLGTGGAVGAVAALPGSAYAVGVDPAKGEEFTAFNFVCRCDRSLIAKVPKNVGDVVRVECDCGRQWVMVWEGDHFNARGGAGAYDERRQYEVE